MGRLIILLCSLWAVSAGPIAFRNCEGTDRTLSVDISPCSSQPCVFTHNVTATVKITFRAPADSATLRANIYGHVAGMKVGWPMPNPDGCLHSNITCPVHADRVYTYTNTLGVPGYAPAIRLVVEWSLTGSGGEKQFCIDFPMEIADH